jgi:hypothetical protein
MDSINNELASLQSRIAHLEEMKKAIPATKTLQQIRNEISGDLARSKHSQAATAAAFHDQRRLDLVNAIIESLEKIHTRLDKLENNGESSCKLAKL